MTRKRKGRPAFETESSSRLSFGTENRTNKRFRRNEESRNGSKLKQPESLTMGENGKIARCSLNVAINASSSSRITMRRNNADRAQNSTIVATPLTQTAQAAFGDNIDKKVAKLIKNPFSGETQTFFVRTCKSLQRATTKHLEQVGLSVAALKLSAAGKIYVAQTEDFGRGVDETARGTEKNPSSHGNVNTQDEAATEFERARSSGQNDSELQMNSLLNVSTVSSQELISNSTNGNDENGDTGVSYVSLSSITEAAISDHEGNTDNEEVSQDLESTFETRNQLRDQLNEGPEGNNETDEDSVQGSTLPMGAADAGTNSLHLHTLPEALNGSLEVNEVDDAQSETRENTTFSEFSRPLGTSTPKNARYGAAAGTRNVDINQNSRFHMIIAMEKKGSPMRGFGKRERTHVSGSSSGVVIRRQLFEDTLNPSVNSDGIGFHIGPVLDENPELTPRLIVEEGRIDEPQEQEVPQTATATDQFNLFDCLHRLMRDETQNRADINATRVFMRNVSHGSVDRLDAEENSVANVNESSIMTEGEIGPMPPSQLFRLTCDPNDNTGQTIMGRSLEKGRKDSKRIGNQIYLELVDPMLRRAYIKSAVFEHSIASLEKIAQFHLTMGNILKKPELRFNVPDYEMRILNTANSFKLKDTETELSQESGYGSQCSQESNHAAHAQPENSEWVQFEALVSQSAKTPQEVARSFVATMFLAEFKCLEVSFGAPPDMGCESASSTSGMMHQSEPKTDINDVYFKAIKTISRTEDFKRHETELAQSATTITRGSGNAYSLEEDSDCDVFEDTEPVVYRGQLFSERSQKLKERKRAKLQPRL